jgi:hypothetical protein
LKTPDIQIAGPLAFAVDDGELVFGGLTLNINTANKNYLISVDVTELAKDGRTFQFQVPTARSIDGLGAVTMAPPIISNGDMVGGLRTILRNEFAVREDTGGERELRDRKELPRRGGFGDDPFTQANSEVVAWNFMIDVSENEPLTVEQISIQVSGTFPDASGLISARLGDDNDRDGMFMGNEFLVGEVANISSLGEDPLLVFNAPTGEDVIELKADDSARMELYLTLDAPASAYGTDIQFTLVNMQLRGVFSQALALRATDPFQSVVKPIRQPRAFIVTSNAVAVEDGRFQCVNAAHEFTLFTMGAGLSESIYLSGVEVASSLSGGQLSNFAPDGVVWRSMNQDDDIGIDDIFLGGGTVGPDGAGFLTVNPTDDSRALFYRPTPIIIGAAVSLNTATPVTVDGSVRLFSDVTQLHGVGEDSGDDVIFDFLPDSAAFNGMIAGNLMPLPRAFQEDLVAPGATGIEAWKVTTLGISPTEDLQLESFRLKIAKSPGLDLTQVVAPDAFFIGYRKIGEAIDVPFGNTTGTVDFATETVTFPAGISPFYSDPFAINQMGVYVNLLNTAPEGAFIELQLVSPLDLRFASNGCSLVDSTLIEHDFAALEATPLSTHRLIFQTEGLRFELKSPDDDLPWVALPDLAVDYPIARFRMRTINGPELEAVQFLQLTVHATGTADDVAALAAGNGLKLYLGSAMVAEGAFDANDGAVVFTGFDLSIDRSFQDFEIRATTSDLTRTGVNDGQTINLSFDTTDVVARGSQSQFPTRNFIGNYDEEDDLEDFPYLFPEVRIGAGRIFIRQPNVDDFFTVSDAVDVATMPFSLKPDRAENVELEELTVSMVGTMIDPDAIDGAALRFYLDKNPTGEVNLTGNSADVLIGVGPITMDDGTARARFTPPIALDANSSTNFLISVDLNGLGLDFEDFRHSLLGPTAVIARGELSFPSPPAGPEDLLDPHYGTDKAIDPDAGLIEGALITLGKATLDFRVSTDLPEPDGMNPVYILPDQDGVPMLALEYEALEIEDMKALSFTFISSGDGDELAAVEPEGVHLYIDLDKDGNLDATDVEIARGSFSADNETLTISSVADVNILKGDEAQWLLAYDFGPLTGLNRTFNAALNLAPETLVPREDIVGGSGLFSLRPIGVIRSSPADAPFAGPIIQTTTGIVRATKGPNSSGNRDVLPQQTDVVFMQAQMEELFDLEDVRLTRLELNVLPEGISVANLFDPASLRLYREATVDGQVNPEDGAPIATGTLSVSAQRITFDLSGVNEIVEKGERNSYLVVGNLNAPLSAAGAKFRVEVSTINQLAGIGQTTQGAATFRLGSSTLTSGQFTLNVATAAFTRLATTPGASDGISPDATNQILLAVSIKPSSAADLQLQSLRVDANGSINEVTAFAPGSIRLLRDQGVGGQVDPADIVLAAGDFPGNNGSITFAPPSTPQSAFARNSTTTLFVVGDLNGTAAEGQTMALTIPGDFAISVIPTSGGDASATGNFPIASGPTPIASLRVTAGPRADQPGGLAVASTSEDATLWLAQLTASQAEDIEVTSLTFDFSGSANDLLALSGGQAQLVRDQNNNGLFDEGDVSVAVATLTGDNGQAAFPNLSLQVPRGATQNILVAADMSGMANNGETLLLALTGMTAQGNDTERPAQVAGLPFLGPLVTIAPASFDFRFAGAESVSSFALSNEANYAMQTLRLAPSSADDVTLEALTFSLADVAMGAFVTPGSLRVVHDANFTGVFESEDDVILAQGASFDGAGRAVFDLQDIDLPKAKSTFLLLVADLNGSAPDGAELRVLVQPGDVTATARTSGQPAAANGLPYSSSPKTLRDPAFKLLAPMLEDFPGSQAMLRPALTWELVVDENQALSGPLYMRALDSSTLLPDADYALLLNPPLDAAAAGTPLEVSYWVRHNFASTNYRGRMQISINGGSSWTNLATFQGDSQGWVYDVNAFNTPQNSSNAVLLRALMDGGADVSASSFFHVDRVLVQPAPRVEIRDFKPGPGFTKTVTPMTSDYRVLVDLRSTRTTDVQVTGFGFRFQSLTGQRLDSFMTVTPITGAPGEVLIPNQTKTFEYRWDFSPALPSDIARMQADAFVELIDLSTSQVIRVESYTRGDYFIDIIDPRTGLRIH